MENITGKINPKVYESPDGGLTVTVRDAGDLSENRVIYADVGDNPEFDEHLGLCDSALNCDPIIQAVRQNSYFVDQELCEEHPDLKAKWEEFRELQRHYQAWDLLKK